MHVQTDAHEANGLFLIMSDLNMMCVKKYCRNETNAHVFITYWFKSFELKLCRKHSSFKTQLNHALETARSFNSVNLLSSTFCFWTFGDTSNISLTQTLPHRHAYCMQLETNDNTKKISRNSTIIRAKKTASSSKAGSKRSCDCNTSSKTTREVLSARSWHCITRTCKMARNVCNKSTDTDDPG